MLLFAASAYLRPPRLELSASPPIVSVLVPLPLPQRHPPGHSPAVHPVMPCATAPRADQAYTRQTSPHFSGSSLPTPDQRHWPNSLAPYDSTPGPESACARNRSFLYMAIADRGPFPPPRATSPSAADTSSPTAV